MPQRAGAGSGVPASVWEVVASGAAHPPPAAASADPRRPGSDRRRDRAWSAWPGSAKSGVSQLSGGQQQRALIARALAGSPDLFFLDEPTAGVDLPNQQALADALRQLKDRGSTIVLVAHELGAMAPLVDRAVVMRDGRVAYDGAPLADHEVHHADFGEAHTHHHHPGHRSPTTRPCARRA